MEDESRPSSAPAFWDERYEREPHLFGTAPNAFVASEIERLAAESEIVEVGAGEARTLIWLSREHGHRGTAVDFSTEALAAARQRAHEEDISLHTIEADVRSWVPDRRWDAALVTFLQLLPHERPRLYDLLQDMVRPGGWIFGEWFRPAHLNGTFDRIGPSTVDRMVPPSEIEAAFSGEELVRCSAEEVVLREGEHLNGEAAVVRAVIRTSDGGTGESP